MNPNIARARNTIMKALNNNGVFQFRYCVKRNSKGTKTKTNNLLRTAMLQLNNESMLKITGERMFGSAGISGVNYVVIK